VVKGQAACAYRSGQVISKGESLVFIRTGQCPTGGLSVPVSKVRCPRPALGFRARRTGCIRTHLPVESNSKNSGEVFCIALNCLLCCVNKHCYF
jgi:hypothetical protein